MAIPEDWALTWTSPTWALAKSSFAIGQTCTGSGGLAKVKLHLNPAGTQALSLG